MDDLATRLDELVPRFAGRGDWPAVLRDAGMRKQTRRRRWVALAAALAVMVGAAAAILAWPSTTTGPSFLERARAAVGTGPVVHFVIETDYRKVIVNLETGERQPTAYTQEIWFDPDRGVHVVARFEGVVQSNSIVQIEKMRESDQAGFAELATGYTNALATGTARIVERALIDGEPVRWIEVGTYTSTSVDPTHPTLYSDDVAVSERTYEPVAFRTRLKGETVHASSVRSFETLPEGAGDFTPAEEDGMFSYLGGGGPALTAAEAKELLGSAPLWVGPSLGDRPFVEMREDRYEWSSNTEGEGDTTLSRSVLLTYSADRVLDTWKNAVTIKLRPGLEAMTMLDVGIRDYVPPAGSILVQSSSRSARGFLKRGGLIVFITAPNEETVLDAARALRPYDG
jgi:hypothetical protein